MLAAAQTSDSSLTGDSVRKDDIRWAQVELRDRGFYKGSLDGILGPEMKRALGQFQKNNGLGRTASLDEQTWEELTADPGIGQGSSMPPAPERTGGSDLGRKSAKTHQSPLRSAARLNRTPPNWGTWPNAVR